MEIKLDKNLIKPGEIIAIAFSGGKDSSALFHALNLLKNQIPFTLKAINIEHGIRGESSVNDSLFVKNECQKNNVELLSYSVDALSFSKENGYSVEQGARILRYQCFENALKQNFCDKIATAHHKSDLAETVLFNIFRGSGLTGVSGIDKSVYNDKIIRPLIDVTRKEIDLYADFYNISFVEDQTNFESEYSRNYIRNEIMPKILERFEQAEDSIQRFGIISKSDDEYLFSLAISYIEKRFDGYFVRACNLHPSILSRATILTLKKLGATKDYTKKHIDGVCELLNSTVGSKICLLNSIIAIRDYDGIFFKKQEIKPEIVIPLQLGKVKFNNFTISLQKIDKKAYELAEKKLFKNIEHSLSGKHVIYFDLDKCNGAEIRNVVSGDTFEKINSGSKSLKKHLVDKKIPYYIREALPIIATKKQVFAVVGIETSALAKVDSSTTKICKATICFND